MDMRKREVQKFYHSITNIKDEYIEETQIVKKKRKRPLWLTWGVSAACLCLLYVSFITISSLLQHEPALDKDLTDKASDTNMSVVPDAEFDDAANIELPETSDEGVTFASPEVFVPIADLLVSNRCGTDLVQSEAAMYGKVPIEQYIGIYEKVSSAESEVLSESTGINVSGEEGWYYVSGHTDMQYLIRNDSQDYSLWKFLCFDCNEYPYRDVLELVYRVGSAEAITEIEVSPPTMDNTDGGKTIQEKIGIHTITDRTEIDTIYQILASLTCYGENHWDMIDYGMTDAPADTKPSHRAVLLGRYLSIVTDYGNEIDGLKYTAVSDMFYEFSGIAYNQLTPEQAESIYEILGITESVEELQDNKPIVIDY